jgi:hypothetical protein
VGKDLTVTGDVLVSDDLTVTGNVAVDTDTLFVDTVNDRVGIGTTSPDTRLTVLSPTAVMPSLYNVGYKAGACIMVSENEYNVEDSRAAAEHKSTLILSSDHAYDSGKNAGGSIGFAAKNQFSGYAVQYGQISGVRESNFYGGLSFSTMHNLNNGQLMEDMRIVDGNVGIGTATMDHKLNVYGTVDALGYGSSGGGTFYMNHNSVRTVYTMSTGDSGLLYCYGSWGAYGLAYFQWKSGITTASCNIIVNSGFAAFQTDGGTNIWLKQTTGSAQHGYVKIIKFRPH